MVEMCDLVLRALGSIPATVRALLVWKTMWNNFIRFNFISKNLDFCL